MSTVLNFFRNPLAHLLSVVHTAPSLQLSLVQCCNLQHPNRILAEAVLSFAISSMAGRADLQVAGFKLERIRGFLRFSCWSSAKNVWGRVLLVLRGTFGTAAQHCDQRCGRQL